MSLSYFGKEPCHRNAKHGELYHRGVCEVCGEEYDKKDEEQSK
ncbi:MAG: hypothetical protein ACW99A_02830 [Candidatus Kariarchaeaceae archaeon]|jgi:hypothetical protein